MKNSKISSKYLILLFGLFISFNPNCVTTQVEAMDRAINPKTSLRDFKFTDTYRIMRDEQRNALEGVWNSYGTINSKNMVSFFSQLDVLSQKVTDGKGVLRNGKILGQQAGDIKKYIKQELSKAAPQLSVPAQQPTPTNMLLTDRQKGSWRGYITDLTQEEIRESVYKVFNMLCDYTKTQFGGKGLIAANAENLMTFDQLHSFLDNFTGIGPNRNEKKGLCFFDWDADGTRLYGTLFIPGLDIQMGSDKIPKGFFTPEAVEFFKNTPAVETYEILEGGTYPLKGCTNTKGW